MKKILLVFGCVAVLLFTSASVKPQEQPVKHGGKFETKYDGFNYETIMRLQKMKVSCDGFKDKFKDACVSMEIVLHCPGTQLNFVRNVTVQLFFENKDWVHFHPPDQRDLSVVIDSGTLKLGRMQRANVETPGTWNTKLEILETTIPYDAFKKIAASETVEVQVGKSMFELREKNLLALRDLGNRVIESNTTSAAPKNAPKN